MDLKAVSSSGMFSKKALKGMFYGPAGGFFSQKKKASLGNVKYSGDEKNISLKSGSGANVYSNVKSLSGDDENVSMFGGFVGSFLDSAVNTPKAKRVNTGVNFGFSIGSPNFKMNEEMKPLPPPLRKKIPLDKIWINLKIIKISVEVSVKKSFALDINLLAVKGKLAMQKTQFIRKIFSKINGFGRATTLSKFEEIIRSTFTSEESMRKAASLAEKEGIIVNNNVRKQRLYSDQAVVIKEIPMDTLKNIIVAAVFEFGQVKAVVEFAESSQADQLAAKWFFLIRKNSVCMAKTASRDQYKALLFTLPVETMAHDLGDFLAGADTGNRVCCAMVCFKNNEVLKSAFHMEPIFGGCERYGKLGHSVLECNAEISTPPKLSKSFKRVVSDENHLQLAKLYAKKSVLISRPAVFGSKLWAQIVFLVSLSNGSHFGSGSGFGSSSGVLGVIGHLSFVVPVYSILKTHFASLEHFLELLTDRVSGIVNKLNNLNLVPMTLTSFSQLLVIPVMANIEFGLNMVLNDSKPVVLPPSLVSSSVSNLDSNGSKILTLKMGCLELKLMTLKALVCSVLEKLDQICAGSGSARIVTCNMRGVNIPAKQNNVVRWHMDSENDISIIMETKLKSGIKPWIMNKFPGVCIFTSELDTGSSGADMAVIINSFVARHVSKINEIPGRLISIKLLFKSKLLVTILDIYAGASAGVRFGQALTVNSLITNAINSSFFVILGEDFNELDTKKSASLRKCTNLSLVNSFKGHFLASSPMWSNSKGVIKVIDYIFVSENLVSALMK
ncbi:hypothetical protein G9A89_005978 [Geosiphon pyriformis]|nr:hypothetical protein G9A89_005978 [Geosiphon pyriformis]